ncbi:MAG: oligosaccharide flippase family protein [Pseudomonadota bacterium]
MIVTTARQRIGGLLRFFSDDSGASLAQLRERRIALSAAMAMVAKAVAVLAGIISVPLTLDYLGTERFGLWMMLSSLIVFLNFADLGIGNGLVTLISAAHGRDDTAAVRAHVSSAFCVLTAMAALILGVFAALYAALPWDQLFNLTSDLARAEAGPSVAALILCTACAIPAGIVQRAQMALQLGYWASSWQCAANLLALAMLVLAIWAKASLPILVLAFVGTPVLVGVINAALFFGVLRPAYRPSFGAVSRAVMGSVVGKGVLFLLLQVFVAVTFMSDNFFIAHKIGAEAVAGYAVPEKLFGLIGMLIALSLAPLWPAYGEALARGDRDWTRRTLRRSTLWAGGIAALACGAMVLAAPMILSIWTAGAVTAALPLLLALAAVKVVDSVARAVSMYLCGANVILLQVVLNALAMVAAVVLKLWLIDVFGLSGAAWATAISYGGMLIALLAVIRWRRLV